MCLFAVFCSKVLLAPGTHRRESSVRFASVIPEEVHLIKVQLREESCDDKNFNKRTLPMFAGGVDDDTG